MESTVESMDNYQVTVLFNGSNKPVLARHRLAAAVTLITLKYVCVKFSTHSEAQ